MNKDRNLTRFILVALISEITAQRLLTTNKLMLSEAIHNVNTLVNTPIDALVGELIESLRDMELDNILAKEEDDISFDDLTDDNEWFEMIAELVDEIRLNSVENGK